MKTIKKFVPIRGEGASVLISDTECGIDAWVYVWTDGEGEVCVDWNAGIFDLSTEIDDKLMAFQENTDNFCECSVLAIERYEDYLEGFTDLPCRCNNCMGVWDEEELDVVADKEDGDWMRACPNCLTDAYLMDAFIPVKMEK